VDSRCVCELDIASPSESHFSTETQWTKPLSVVAYLKQTQISIVWTQVARSTERGIRPPSEWCALHLGACVGDDEFASWIVITGQALFFSVTAVSVIPGEDDWHTQCVPLQLSTIQGGTLAKDFLGRNKHIPSLD
jgi:hypothetical protein